MIRAVSFDVGGTLIRAHPSVGHVYAEAGRPFALGATPAALNEAFRVAWAARERGGRDRPNGRSWWRRLVDGVFDDVHFAGDRDGCFAACYDAFARVSAWRVFDDVRPTLDRLQQAGIRMGVVSNWDERLPRLLTDLGLTPFFAWLLVSAQEGLQKPDPLLFERVRQAAGCTAGEILHVGDTREDDLTPARRGGMQARLIHRGAESSGSVIGSLGEVLTLVGDGTG